jgi:hypothetical protein
MLACRADKASAPSQVKKQFQEKNLYEKVVIPAFTSQTGENQRLSPPSSNFRMVGDEVALTAANPKLDVKVSLHPAFQCMVTGY